MLDAENPIPQSLPTDSEDVELALEAAHRLHQKGDYAEALKWLRRAVIAADEVQDDRRQLQLARASADYVSILEAQASSAKTSVIPPPPISRPSNSAPQSYSKPPPPVRSSTPPPSGRASTGAGPEGSTSHRESFDDVAVSNGTSLSTPPPIVGIDSPVSVREVVDVSSGSSIAKDKTKDSRSALLPTASYGSEIAPSSGAVRQSPVAYAAPQSLSTQRVSSVPQSGRIGADFPDASRRVYVRVSARDENLFIVRPLAPGQSVPIGCREALLVFSDGAQETATAVGQGTEMS